MSIIPDDIKEMDDRINAMKNRKNGKTSGDEKKSDYSQAAIVFQITIEMVSGVFVGAAIGYILDELFDFKFICLLIFTIFGGFAGILNTARYLKKYEDEREER